MATAEYFVNRAMSRVGVKTAEINLEASEAQTGLDLFNDMMSAWEVVRPIGFVAAETLDSVARIPRFAFGAVVDNLAIVIAPEFQKAVSAELAATARGLKDDMRTALVTIKRVQYPSTLPTGSGNQCHDSFHDDRFFPADIEKNF
jgi:hypothetical protein